MENRLKSHDQEKVTDHDTQTAILDQLFVAETDELDPAFHTQIKPEDNEDLSEEDDDLFPTEEDLQNNEFDADDDGPFGDEDDEY